MRSHYAQRMHYHIFAFSRLLSRIVQHERYGALTLVNTTGADTGVYTCYPMYCEDADCRKEYGKAVKVFAFFPGTINVCFIDADTHFYVL